MMEMSCEEHGRLAAESQFVTHTIGRILSEMRITNTPIDTKGFGKLLEVKESVANDSLDLYMGLFIHNRFAKQQMKNLESAVESVKELLEGRMECKDEVYAIVEFDNPKRARNSIEILPNATETIGVSVLKSRGIFPEAYWYWIAVAASLGYIVLFNICFTLALGFLSPFGNPQAVLSEESMASRKAMKEESMASRVGAAAKFTGSGGAAVAFCPDGPLQVELLTDACKKAGFSVVPVEVVPQC